MSVDQATVRRIAHLARIAVSEAEVPHLQSEINAILAFIAELDAVDVEGVEPMTSVIFPVAGMAKILVLLMVSPLAKPLVTTASQGQGLYKLPGRRQAARFKLESVALFPIAL